MNIKSKQKLNFIRTKELKKKATNSELIFKKRLENLNIKYMFQKGFIVGNGFYIADFYLPKPYKTIIEIDGEYHLSEKQIEYDKRRDLYFKNRRIKTIRIKNEDVETFDLNFLFK